MHDLELASVVAGRNFQETAWGLFLGPESEGQSQTYLRRLLCSELFRSFSAEDEMIDISLVLIFRSYCSAPKMLWTIVDRLLRISGIDAGKTNSLKSLDVQTLVLVAFQILLLSFWISSE